MKVIDRIQKCERDLTTAELIDMVAKENRQVDLTFDAKQTDEDGYLSWDAENWTSVDGKRFIRSYSDVYKRQGVYAAGDLRVKSLRQVVTAAADGAIAAMQAEKYIANLK